MGLGTSLGRAPGQSALLPLSPARMRTTSPIDCTKTCRHRSCGSAPRAGSRRRRDRRLDTAGLARRGRRSPSLNLNQHGVALDLHVVALDALVLVHRVDAGRDVVLPAVPRTGHDYPVELALPERAAAVEARVVDGVEDPPDIEERDLLATRLNALPRAGRHVADRRDAHEVRHGAASGTRSGERQDASADATAGRFPKRPSQAWTAGTRARSARAA